MTLRRTLTASLLTLGIALAPATASAFPGFFAGKDSQERLNYSTHVTVLTKGDKTVVTVAPDYEGPLNDLVIVLPVPSDVTEKHLGTAKRTMIGGLERMTAPRFHEFWEMDPCEKGEVKQEWERDLKAKGSGFLGKGKIPSDLGDPKKAKELNEQLDLQLRPDSEYSFEVVAGGQLLATLEKNGFKAPAGADAAIKPYVDAGMKFILATVDTKKIELVGERAELSPIRYWTEKPMTTVPSKLGLLNAGKVQELFIYVLHPDKRYEVKNYENLIPPSNIELDLKAKEKMGHFYSGYHEAIRKKKPKAFLTEYVWSTEGCGQPCPPKGYPSPLSPGELLTLGGEILDQDLPEEERNPEPPEMSEDEKKVFDAKKKPQQEAIEQQRKDIARIRALKERHKYVVTRLHHRYDKASLPSDPELAAAATKKRAGVDIPKGKHPDIEVKTDSYDADSENSVQTRFVLYHPWKSVNKCEDPINGRWGLAWKSYRGNRTIYTAQGMAVKDPKKRPVEKMVKTPIPMLGLAGAKKAAAAADAGADATKEDGGACGCSVPGAPAKSGALLGLGLLLGLITRRRTERRNTKRAV